MTESSIEQSSMSRKRKGFFKGVSGYGFYNVINVLLFSLLSEVAYVGVIFYTDVLKRCNSGDAFSLLIFVLTPILFNLLCFGLLRLNSAFNRHYPVSYYNGFKMMGLFGFYGVAFIVYNYFVYVSLVALTGTDGGSPFVPTESIIWQISLISSVQLVIMALITLNQTARFTIMLYKEREELKQIQARAEIKALQSQLNPHFLFNSLNVLVSEIDYDPVSAKKFTIDLAGVYRYILQKQDKTMVSVYEELNFLRSYIRLNQTRVGESLHFDCLFPERSNLDFLQYRYVPSLSLQLLVENALKHNVVSALKPLYITVSFTDNLEYLIVENNRNPKKKVASLGTGLKNLSERYRLLAGKDIVIEKSPDRFRVKIPMLLVD